MKKIYIGMDNGLDGAFVANLDGKLVKKFVMPTLKTGKGNKRIVFTQGLDFEFGGALKDPEVKLIFCVEPAQMIGSGSMALASTWYTWGRIEEWLINRCVSYHPVNPQKWQKAFWTRPKLPKGQKFDTKAAALRAANQIWPGTDWRAGERHRIPHDGIVDAALISEYARRLNL